MLHVIPLLRRIGARQRRQTLDKSALILNFTANTYHWGCFATSVEVYESLVGLGYYVNWLTVAATHCLGPTPPNLSAFYDDRFIGEFLADNKELGAMLREADLIIVNGEGTLHRLGPAPRNLLFLAHLAKSVLGKRVVLINHSFYPSGAMSPEGLADTLYGSVAKTLDLVVPREGWSKRVLDRLGVPCRQGFDCLPRFVERVGLKRHSSAAAGPILLSGGVTFKALEPARLARSLAQSLPTNRPVRFLSGAKAFSAEEDPAAFEAMRAEIPRLELRFANDVNSWLKEISESACLISGRFHHTLAAAVLGTPTLAFRSNTPKIEAASEMLELEEPLSVDMPDDLSAVLADRLPKLLRRESGLASPGSLKRAVSLAGENFRDL